MCYLSLVVMLVSLIPLYSVASESRGNKVDLRCAQYKQTSERLNSLNDEDISKLLKAGVRAHSGIGGTSFKLEIDGLPVFVKLVPLNEIEGKSENRMSTKNLFGLPCYYQYGVGSAGFSVWREVSAHLMSTSWVLNDKSQNFPLLYHWRVVTNSQEKAPLDEKKLAESVAYWNGSSAVGQRLRANHDTTTYVALFLEYIPESLHSWLHKQLLQGESAFDRAIEMVEKDLLETVAFINSQGMLHFDAHFRNILTDGERLYFSDFGLATSSQFALSEEEAQFFHSHQNYDRCFVSAKLVNWIIKNVFGKDRFDEVLQAYASGKMSLVVPEKVTPRLSSILKRYAPMALKMNMFFDKLMHETKLVPYPGDELKLLQNSEILQRSS